LWAAKARGVSCCPTDRWRSWRICLRYCSRFWRGSRHADYFFFLWNCHQDVFQR